MEKLIEKIISKAHQAKEELEHKMAEVAQKVYAKMDIAHADHVKELKDEVINLKRELALAEARIVSLEGKK